MVIVHKASVKMQMRRPKNTEKVYKTHKPKGIGRVRDHTYFMKNSGQKG